MSDYNIFGHWGSKFAKVEEVFRQNFKDGFEFEGASFSVYHKGKPVVDLGGGWADSSALRPWTDKSRTVVFSTTKGIGALCIAILVDRGCIKYSDKIMNFWPEFGQNGKEDITLEMIMNHQSGLPVFSEEVTLEDAQNNPEKISKIIEASQPLWKPGTKSGYHAITYGWLVDQIVRRVDPKKRSVGVFFKEEVADKHGIDFHLGLPKEEAYTVSRLVRPTAKTAIKEIWTMPKILSFIFWFIWAHITKWGYPQVFKYPTWMGFDKGNPYNNPEYYSIEQVAVLGITRAKDLAKLFSLFSRGEIVSKELVEQFYAPVVYGMDAVLPIELLKGHGFFYEPHPKKSGKYLLVCPGNGGNIVVVAPEEDLVMAYVTNGMKSVAGDMCYTYRVLRNAVFDCLEKFDEKNLNEASGKDAVAASENLIN